MNLANNPILKADAGDAVFIVGAVIFGLVFLTILVLVFSVFSLWFQALVSGARISFAELVGMKFRKVNGSMIVRARIEAHKAGIAISSDKLEAHYLAGGNVLSVVRALIMANKARLEMDFDRAVTIDLAGRNVLEAVTTSVNPKVIDCPERNNHTGRTSIDAVCKDGIQLKVRARVTVRTSLDRLVGGATEETIVARVGEGIVSAIGSAGAHSKVLENPDLISKAVLSKGLDSGTAYEILSIDIADVDVGNNIGAKLQAEQAEADKRVAQAKAEERRSMAVAHEQEMIAKVQENRAELVLSEAEVPKAISDALRSGNFGVMDYFNLKNLNADTSMRKSIGGDDSSNAGI